MIKPRPIGYRPEAYRFRYDLPDQPGEALVLLFSVRSMVQKAIACELTAIEASNGVVHDLDGVLGPD